jgi:hypothetical protein
VLVVAGLAAISAAALIATWSPARPEVTESNAPVTTAPLEVPAGNGSGGGREVLPGPATGNAGRWQPLVDPDAGSMTGTWVFLQSQNDETGPWRMCANCVQMQ